MTMTTLDGYVALLEHWAKQVEEAGALTPQMFGGPYKYIPFAGTPEMALENAMRSCKSPPQLATQPTQWYILKVSITSDQLMELFTSGVVRHGAHLAFPPDWRFYGELKLVSTRFWWDTLTIAPVGLPQWAETTLSWKYKLRAFSCCSGCGEGGPAWATSSKPGRKEWCARCWNAWLSERMQADGQETDPTGQQSILMEDALKTACASST